MAELTEERIRQISQEELGKVLEELGKGLIDLSGGGVKMEPVATEEKAKIAREGIAGELVRIMREEIAKERQERSAVFFTILEKNVLPVLQNMLSREPIVPKVDGG